MSSAEPTESTLAVGRWLDRLRAGDETAREELLDASMRRLRRLAQKILGDIPSVRQFEETDDLLQNSLVRLWKCLASTTPSTVVDYYRLAACLIRRELIDLSRRHQGTRAAVLRSNNPQSDAEFAAPLNPEQDTFDPQQLSQWTEFHEYVERLPEDERSLFDLLWYQGLSMAETSDLLGVPLRSLGRRWKIARVRLFEDLLS